MNNQDEPEEQEETAPAVTLEQMIELLPSRVDLVYIDYRDNLDEQLDLIQECITKQDYEPIDNSIDEWTWEAEVDSIHEIFDELRGELTDKYDMEKEDADTLIDDNRDDLEEYLYEHNDANPLKDLLHNTQDPVTFYDTGFYVDTESWTWDRREMRNWREKVKRALKIPAKEHKYDSDIVSMLANASYGGRLVVYFWLDLSDFDTFVQLGDLNTIRFSNPAIAIIDTGNGSGDHTFLPGHTFTLPLDPDNITIDKTIKYNYTYEVCGMYSDWCKCTDYELLNVEKPKRIKKSSVNAEKAVEEGYKATYAAGGCTFGDMDIYRHRNTYYDNNFPCGTHCPHCHTFWID